MRQPKIGMVLEGGGAKGAYQFGVLRRFAEEGIFFDCVAGTSVGGLNGALWASGKLAEGEQLWSTLSQDKIYPWRLPRWLGLALAVAIVALSVAVHWLQGAIEISMSRAHRIAVGAVGLSLIAVAVVAWLTTHPVPSLLSGAIGSLLVSVALYGTGKEGASYLKSLIEGYLALVGVVGFFLLLGLIAFNVSFSDDETRSKVLFGLVIFLPILVGAAIKLAVALFRFFGRTVMAQNVLGSAPLRQELSRILSNARLAIPLYVTLAEHRRLPDPDNLYEVPDGTTVMRDIATGRGSASSGKNKIHVPRAFVPHYFNLRGFDLSDLVDALMATAALPLGLVPAVHFRGGTYVDGGIADNRPLLPLTSLDKCEKIVVVCVNPVPCATSEAEWDDAEKERWRQLQRLIDLSQYDWETALKQANWILPQKNDPPTRCPFRSPDDWPEILFIAPSLPLGDFLNGTMNFTVAYAQEKLELGYADAGKWLADKKDWFATGLSQSGTP